MRICCGRSTLAPVTMTLNYGHAISFPVPHQGRGFVGLTLREHHKFWQHALPLTKRAFSGIGDNLTGKLCDGGTDGRHTTLDRRHSDRTFCGSGHRRRLDEDGTRAGYPTQASGRHLLHCSPQGAAFKAANSLNLRLDTTRQVDTPALQVSISFM
jgi:hypothetical protein